MYFLTKRINKNLFYLYLKDDGFYSWSIKREIACQFSFAGKEDRVKIHQIAVHEKKTLDLYDIDFGGWGDKSINGNNYFIKFIYETEAYNVYKGIKYHLKCLVKKLNIKHLNVKNTLNVCE